MRLLKILGILLLIAVVLTAGVGVYLWRTAPKQVEWLGAHYLTGMGIQPVTLEIGEIRPDFISIRRFSVGDPVLLTLSDISFPYDPKTVYRDHVIGSMKITEATLALPVDEGKLSFGVFNKFLAPSENPKGAGAGFNPAMLPAPSLEIATLHVYLRDPHAGEKHFVLRNASLQREGNRLILNMAAIQDLTQPPVIGIGLRLNAEMQFAAPSSWKGVLQSDDRLLTLNFYGQGDGNYLENTRGRLDVRTMPIQTPVNLIMQEGLAISGNFSGTLPLRFKDGHVVIDDAKFIAREEGVIQYTGEGEALGAGSEQAAIVETALRNFHYKILSFTVNTVNVSRAEIRATIQGNNPNLYEGKPINLNIVIGGDLEGIVKNLLTVYGLPREIEKQIREQ